MENDEKDVSESMRIALSCPPELYNVLKRISVASDQPISKVVVGFLVPSIPAMRKIATALEAVQKMQSGVGKFFGRKYGVHE